MTARSIALSLLLIFWLAGPLQAQQPPPPPPASTIDASKLPVNLTRLQTQLRAAVERERRDQIDGVPHLRFNIDVLGTAPQIRLFTEDDNLLHGPVPYGAPTHADMINLATPQEFRAPAMDFSNLMRWIQSKVGSKN
jgi:hypothetical protein